jgi:formylglycine-generating enzyme required for sulfatase activity
VAQADKSEKVRNPFEPEMVLIPAGPFLMGSPKSDRLRGETEPEQFELNLDYDYAIGKYPVTVGQYRAFVEVGGYRERRFWTRVGWQRRSNPAQPDHWSDSQWAGDDLLPVVGVTWYEVSAYTRWLAETTGRAYRLPSEAEWEKAARGSLELPDGLGSRIQHPNPARRWPWGDEEPDDTRLNFNDTVKHTTPVGMYLKGASPYGALDMAGNVWEWCLNEWVNPYVHPETNDAESDGLRVVRGGSWFNTGNQARCSYRLRLHPNLRFDHDVGFRVAG